MMDRIPSTAGSVPSAEGLQRQSRVGIFTESIVLLAGFVFCYDYLYVNYLSRYAYLGFSTYSSDPVEFAFACTCVLLAFFCLPRQLHRFSDYFLWFIYAVVYLPAIVTAARMGTLEGGSYHLVSLVTGSIIGMSFLIRVAPVRYLPIAGSKPFSSLQYMVLISVFSLLLLVAVYYPIMGFSGIEEIYDQRALAGGFGAGRFTQYILNWTAYAFMPILLTYGMMCRKLTLVAFGCFGLVVIFMINGAKIVIVIVLLLFTINILFSRRLVERPARLLLIPIAPTLGILLLTLLAGFHFPPTLEFFVSQILMRAIAIQAVMLTVYAEFFDTNTLTYMSHVTGVSSLIQYPYTQPLGVEIGIYLVGGDGFNANSGFWATDGIASFGLYGIPIASVFVAVFLIGINWIGARTNLKFLCLALTPFCLAVANTSFFTAFITGGGLIAVVLSSKLPSAPLR